MNLLILSGLSVAMLSFLAYSLGSVSILNFKKIDLGTLILFSVGLLLDIAAFVILCVSSNTSRICFYFAYHLIILLGLSAMFLNVAFCWRKTLVNGLNAKVGRDQIIYTKVTWGLWSAIYFISFFCFLF